MPARDDAAGIGWLAGRRHARGGGLGLGRLGSLAVGAGAAAVFAAGGPGRLLLLLLGGGLLGGGPAWAAAAAAAARCSFSYDSRARRSSSCWTRSPSLAWASARAFVYAACLLVVGLLVGLDLLGLGGAWARASSSVGLLGLELP